MKYISLFSGVEAATLAWDVLGWEPVAFCEVDEFPAAVLANKWPNVPNLGDITKVDWSKYHGAANLVVGGFPCQSYSIAGLRKGLADPRGELMLEFLRACKEIDPEWVIGENVPGLLSSHRGRDFQTLLEAVAILWPGGGISWRVLDAQFARVPVRDDRGGIAGWFGPVAQRRMRLFLVINTRDWRRAASVFLEQEGLRGDNPSSREKREELARASWRGTEVGCGGGITAFKYSARAAARSMPTYDDESCNTLTADWHSPAIAVRTANTSANGIGVSEECAHTIDCAQPEAIAFAQNQREEVRYIGGDGTVSSCLNAQRFGTYKNETLVCMASGQANAEIVDDGTSQTITCLHEQPIVCVSDDTQNAAIDSNICGTLKVGGGYRS